MAVAATTVGVGGSAVGVAGAREGEGCVEVGVVVPQPRLVMSMTKKKA